MLESFSCRPAPNYTLVHNSEGSACLAPQLNHITYIILELKAWLVKIKAKVKEIKKQLSITHLFLTNEIRHSEKSELNMSSPFQHKYPFQNLKNQQFISITWS